MDEVNELEVTQILDLVFWRRRNICMAVSKFLKVRLLRSLCKRIPLQMSCFRKDVIL